MNGSRATAMLRKVLSIFGFAGWFFFFFPEVTFSQGETTSAIIGQVSDPSGAAVAGATVTAKDVDRGATWRTETNAEGSYNLPRLPVGKY